VTRETCSVQTRATCAGRLLVSCMPLFLYLPVTCNPSRAVTLPNIGISHYPGVPHRVAYPFYVCWADSESDGSRRARRSFTCVSFVSPPPCHKEWRVNIGLLPSSVPPGVPRS